jgi:hypothetical protein
MGEIGVSTAPTYFKSMATHAWFHPHELEMLKEREPSYVGAQSTTQPPA